MIRQIFIIMLSKETFHSFASKTKRIIQTKISIFDLSNT